jgi:hypothetical protein
MTNRSPSEEDLQISALRREIIEKLPHGTEWLATPHELLGGATPAERLSAGGYEEVRQLFYSIVYIGIS